MEDIVKSAITKDRNVTPLVEKFARFNREGDVIPHGWNKHIGTWHDQKRKDGTTRKVWRTRPFACWLLARVIWAYTPSPVYNNAGEVVSYRRKFAGPYWVIDRAEIAAALGCSLRTIASETDLLRSLKLIETRPAGNPSGSQNTRMFVIPNFDAIVAITPANQPAVGEPDQAPSEETSPAPVKKLHPAPVKKLHPSYIPTSGPSSDPVGEGDPDQINVPADRKNQPAPPRKTTQPAASGNGRKEKKAAPHDETLDHPAVKLYQETFSRWPNEHQRKGIIAAVGDSADMLARWNKTLDEWVMNDWKATSVPGMLSRFGKDGEGQPVNNWPRRDIPTGPAPNFGDTYSVFTPDGRELIKRGDDVIGVRVNGEIQPWTA